MQEKKQSQFDKMVLTPIEPLIIKMSIPTVISMLVITIYNMVDTAFVGRLGTSASGAVGIVFGFMAILQAVGFLFGQGSGSIISRRLGQKDVEGASTVASTGFFLALFFSIVVSILCFLFLEPLVYLLGSTKTIAPYAITYVTYILLGAPFIVTSFSLNNILRFEGKAVLGMMGMMTGAVLNMVLDPVFMFGLGMGIAGAGLATCLSQIISFIILVSMFIRGKTQSKVSIKRVSLNVTLVRDVIETGLPSLLRQGLQSLSTVVLNGQAAFYGDAAIAAMSIVSRIIFFVFAVALGIGQGFQPVCGFNYGAKKYGRVRKAFRFAFVLSECLMGIVTIFVFFNAAGLIQIFRNDPEVISIGIRALQLQCIAQLVNPICTMTEMLHQSTGHKWQASLLSALKSGVVFIPILLIMSYTRGLSGIQEAQPIAFLLCAVPCLYFAKVFFTKLPKEDMA